ncbi:MAG TPA: ATP-binding protein [Acidothermaceae bacterium]|nr:ATP-binding protein [Acidothermaceae bacterium]
MSTARGDRATPARSPRKAWPRAWSDLRLRGKGGILVAIPLFIFAVAAALFVFTLKNDGDTARGSRHLEVVERQIAAVDRAIGAWQSDQRDYLALGEEDDLTAARTDKAQLTSTIDALARLVADNSTQLKRVDAVRAALNSVPPPPAAPTSSGGDAAVRSWISLDTAHTAQARAALSDMQQSNTALVAHRRALAQQWRTVAGSSVIGLLVLALFGALLAVWLFTRSIVRRVGALDAELRALEHEPAGPPDDSADELGVLARRLRETADALRRRDAELHEARAFLEGVLTVGPVVVMRVVNRTATYVSPNCERVLGISAEDALSRDFWRSTMSSDEVEQFYATAARLFTPDGPRVVEFEGAFNIGGRRRYLSSLVTREDGSGDELAFLLYMLDVTERRVAERSVAERQRELTAITAASPDVIAVVSADLRVSFISEAVAGLSGRRAADVVGGVVGDVLHEDDRPMLIDAVRAVTSGAAEDFTIRVRSRHTSGRWLLLEAHGRPLLGDDGAPIAAVVVFRDISDRIALEAALVEARDVADAASRAKSEFLSRMSHELRTPLNVVLGFTQLLQMEQLPEEQASWVNQVLKAGRHLLDLINEVLDIARIESGALALSSEPVSLRDVVGDTVESMRPIAAASEISIDFLIEGDDLFVLADRQRIKQVLINLIANAVKYNRPRGSVLVTCKASGDDTTEIRVSDTGIGIVAEHIERLFVPFDRLGAEQSAIEGTGVGLPLSLRLVQAMEGNLSVESTPGEGSTFTVTLPSTRSPGDLEADAAIADAERQIALDDDLRAHGTLLYIEDNLTNLHLMQRVVARRPGIRLLHAPQGRMGLELARTRHADVILLDLHLPDMSGMEVLGQLRADPATANVPVYIVSADATAGQVLRMRSAGAVGYLTKPLDVRRVLGLLDAILEGSVHVSEGE